MSGAAPRKGQWRTMRWFNHSSKTAYEAGIEGGDRMPPITAIEGPGGRNVASAHDLFEFDGEKAVLMSMAPELRDMVAAMRDALRSGVEPDAAEALAGEADALLRWIAQGDVEGRVHDAMNDIRAKVPNVCELEWEIFPDERILHLHLLRARPMRTGAGSAVMRAVTALADQEGMTLRLAADPSDRDGEPDGPALEAWYLRFGFTVTGIDESTGSPLMSREPAAPCS